MNFCRVRMNGQTEDAVSILQDIFSVFANFFLWCVKIFTEEVLVIVLDVSPSSSLSSFFLSLSFFLSRSLLVFAVTLKRFFPLHFFLNKLTIVVWKSPWCLCWSCVLLLCFECLSGLLASWLSLYGLLSMLLLYLYKRSLTSSFANSIHFI